MRRSLFVLALGSATIATGAFLGRTPAVESTKTKQVPDAVVHMTRVLGFSVRHRLITMVVRGDRDSPARELVVGCIHGDEPAGTAITNQLESATTPRDTAFWLVPDANPDGVAANTRTNADGVDLNRNFPWRWHRQGSPGDSHFSGARPLSEPESRLLAALIRRVRPRVTIWFHQPLALVDQSGGNRRLEQRYASLVGLPLRRLARYAGGATDWQNMHFPGTTAFVVELPARLSPQAARRFARAAIELIGQWSSPNTASTSSPRRSPATSARQAATTAASSIVAPSHFSR